MKQALAKGLIFASFVALSACNKGGDSGGGGQQVAQVPGPQGQIASAVPNSYCNFNGGVAGCTSVINGTTCTTNSITYTSIETLCSQINSIQSVTTTNAACNPAIVMNNITDVITKVYSQYCATSTTPFPGSTTGVAGPNSKTISCSFQAYRTEDTENRGGFFKRFLNNGSANTGLLTGEFHLDGTTPSSIVLNGQFFNMGNFGKTVLQYAPSMLRGTADTITLSNNGLNGRLNTSQSGFAGQAVKLDVLNEDGSMKLSVSCSGEKSLFRKNIVGKAFTRYVCRGKSSLHYSSSENIDVAFPYDASLMNSELNLGEGLTASITGDSAGKDDAMITITARGVDIVGDQSLTTVQSSAYLKAQSVLQSSGTGTNVNLKCGPE